MSIEMISINLLVATIQGLGHVQLSNGIMGFQVKRSVSLQIPQQMDLMDESEEPSIWESSAENEGIETSETLKKEATEMVQQSIWDILVRCFGPDPEENEFKRRAPIPRRIRSQSTQTIVPHCL